MMKSLLLVVLLAVAASAAIVSQEIVEDPEIVFEHEEVVYSDDAEVAALEADSGSVDVANRNDLSVGTIGNSRLLTDRQVSGAASNPNSIFVQDNRFNYAPTIRITAIRVTRVGPSQSAHPAIIDGGLNRSFVKIRITSNIGGGFLYRIQIYGV